MTKLVGDRLKDLVNDALELPTERRLAFLEIVAEGDGVLLAEARELVEEFGRLGDFLEPEETAPSLFSTLRDTSLVDDTEIIPDFAGTLMADRYRLQERLGSGGSSAVYAGTDLLTGREVAVKLLLRIPWDDLSWVRREIAVLRLLRLPGVVRLLDDGVFERTPFLVTERLHGRRFPGRDTPAAWDDVAPTALALIEAVARMHANGVLHGDLKPENVIVDASGAPTILDLGISTGPAVVPRERTPDGIFGTPDYLSPERLQGGEPSVRSDLYAMGVMLFECLAGELPYTGEPIARLWKAVRGDPKKALPEDPVRIPGRIAEIVTRLLDVDPERRPRSASEVAASLAGELPPEDFVATLVHGAPLGRADGTRISARDLEALFAGPDRIFHLREDAARELAAKTDGRAESVVREMAAWLRSGLARLSRGVLVVDRDSLEVLRGGGPVSDPESPSVPGPAGGLDEAERWMNEGDVGRARVLAERALDGIRRSGEPAEREIEALRMILTAAIAEGTEHALELFLYQVGNAERLTPEHTRVERLARLALLALRRDGERALAMADAMGPQEEVRLEQIRQSARVMAARVGQENRERIVLPEVRAWAERTESLDIRRQLEESEGWRAYTKGDYDDAAARHRKAVEFSTSPRAKLSALLNVASCRLEAHRLDRAAEVAAEARLLAIACRHAHYEARAEWILRAVAYRGDAAREADLELVEAISGLGVPNLEASICLTEAAVAWRARDESLARELALEAARKWQEIGHRWALPLASGPPGWRSLRESP